MQFHQLSAKDQKRYRKKFEESTVRAMQRYEVAPRWLKQINPLQAAIVDGDFDRYAELLDSVDDDALQQEIIAPGTSQEVKPEDLDYQTY
ncbi:hypothetical protein H6F75_00465 [Nodosilinea sp. FACHB-131]|uniref:hypothetical protein n=1 Tax=Cyanophyceae TaxID=3028117 RepID=UPI001684C865|nr:hypothetical protein [Nodosilinea sp. FACHB-131]MBD1871943.1 hypothetical protein [Nodosilinea sp. FACHB-131]